jgi:hypothetical protein
MNLVILLESGIIQHDVTHPDTGSSPAKQIINAKTKSLFYKFNIKLNVKVFLRHSGESPWAQAGHEVKLLSTIQWFLRLHGFRVSALLRPE